MTDDHESEHDPLAELDATTRDELRKTPLEIIEAAKEMLLSESLLSEVSADLESLGIAGEHQNKLLTYLAATSRLLPKPLYVLVVGPSASGKSHLLNTVARLIPDEMKLLVTAMSKKAIHRMPPGSLRHRVIFGGERSQKDEHDVAELTKPLREMFEGNSFIYYVPTRVAGGWVTKKIRQDGPISFMESTTKDDVFEQDRNRCLIAHADDSSAQTELVTLEQARQAMSNAEPLADEVIQKQHAAQRLLKRVRVKIPFAGRLRESLPMDRVDVRRLFPMILSLIEACALLHQRQRRVVERKRSSRTVRHGDTVVATLDDYEAVRPLLLGPVARAMASGLQGAVAEFAMNLHGWAVGEDVSVFTTKEAKSAMARADLSPGTIGNYVTKLKEHGVLRKTSTPGGSKAIWEFICEPQHASADWLPTREELEDAVED